MDNDDSSYDSTKPLIPLPSSHSDSGTEHDAKMSADQVRKNRTTTLSKVTRLRGLIRDQMEAESDPREVEALLDRLHVLVDEYRQLHLTVTKIEWTQKDEDRFAEHEDTIQGFISRVQRWLESRAEKQMTRDWLKDAERHSEAPTSRSATSTSLFVQRAEQEAQLAYLRVKEEKTKLKQELQRRQQELQAEEELLQIQAEIEGTMVKQQVYEQLEIEPTHVRESSNDQFVENHVSGFHNHSGSHVVASPALTRSQSQAYSVAPGKSHSTQNPLVVPSFDINGDAFPEISETMQPVLNPSAAPFLPSNVRYDEDALVTALTLPKPEINPFSGDVMSFQAFMSAFDFRIGNKHMPDLDKLHYLYQYLREEPRDLVNGCLYMSSATNGYGEARRLLVESYGNPYKLASAYLAQFKEWPQINEKDSAEQLRRLSCFITRCLCAMSESQYLSTLNHPDTLKAIVGKLPNYLRNKWSERAHGIRVQFGLVTLNDLGRFIHNAAEVANDPVFGQVNVAQTNVLPKPNSSKPLNSFAVESKVFQNPTKCFVCDRDGHSVQTCEQVLCKSSVDGRKALLKERGICFACLGHGHIARYCRNRSVCDQCGRKHPTLLHMDRSENQTNDSDKETANTISCTSYAKHDDITFHAVLPVIVKTDCGRSALTYCLLDNGSSGCFVTRDLYDELNMSGRESMMQLKTMHGTSYEHCFVLENLILTDCNGDGAFKLPKVYTRPDIPIHHGNVARSEFCDQIPQLREFKHLLPEYHADASIGILLGCNCVLLEPLEIRHSKASSLYAVRYQHGWTVQGSPSATASNVAVCNRIVVSDNCKEVIVPTRILKVLESDFIDHSVTHPDDKGYSVEDRRFMTLVSDGIRFQDGHYSVPLPLKDRSFKLPCNRNQAMARLMWQTKKMTANDEYRLHYVECMQTLIDKGYCEPVPENQVDGVGKVWYLPHHGVYHAQKPGRVRVVFDCSSRYMGISLNDCLLQGPDLTNNLWGVLTRFRFSEIAFVADLEAMFYQVKVPVADRCYLRFLWWSDHLLGGSVCEYQMTVHIFGASSSPSVANFVIKKIATSGQCNQMIEQIIKHGFYVDDCLYSVSEATACQQLIVELRRTFKNHGFHLTKFNSNDRSVLSSVPIEERAKELKSLNLDLDTLPITRTLGVLWEMESDQFSFCVRLKKQPITRRGVLSTTASLYDPIGFAAPVILIGKQLLQQLCVEQVGWDDPLSSENQVSWLTWLESLPLLSDVKVPRRFFQSETSISASNSQLHVFCDASTVGYGAVAYLRRDDERGNVQVSFVTGKARVAPAKTKTIPRLELASATVAIRLACLCKRELQMPELNVIYHTDSQIVLSYIRSDSRRFPVYVANRVHLIREFSEPDDWRYIPSSLNPADDASRGLNASELQSSVWLRGPEFLVGDPTEWPSQSNVETIPIEQSCITVSDSTTSDSESATDRLINHFSSWSRLRRSVAVFRNTQALLRKPLNDRDRVDFVLNAADLKQAEFSIVRFIQRNHFATDIELLSKEKRTRQKSSLYKLNPLIDDMGLLRVGGRLRRTDWDSDAKHPIILPYKSHVTDLLIRDRHVSLGHAGRNHVLSSIRSEYWVIHGNSAVRRVIASCIHCKRGRGKCLDQQMADLPSCNVTDSMPPFTYVGVDFFGPFEAKEGRKCLKRFGVLFICMNSRAVHIEIAASLDTSSFINALRRCMSRRGHIAELYCDNGTNFVGSKNELQRALRELIPAQAQKWAANQGISWHFNPPKASHMGGTWERAIRSARQVLYGLMKESSFVLDLESLNTIFCEAENIMNSRPLTTVQSDSNDPEPLTPSHILTMKSKILFPPPGNFQRADLFLRKRWRRVQYLCNVFWARWKREYLAILQPRQIWQAPRRNLRTGDVVILKEDAPRNVWPLAIVESVEADDKGVVRAVELRSRNSSFRRPIHKIVLLVPSSD